MYTCIIGVAFIVIVAKESFAIDNEINTECESMCTLVDLQNNEAPFGEKM